MGERVRRRALSSEGAGCGIGKGSGRLKVVCDQAEEGEQVLVRGKDLGPNRMEYTRG